MPETNLDMVVDQCPVCRAPLRIVNGLVTSEVAELRTTDAGQAGIRAHRADCRLRPGGQVDRMAPPARPVAP